VRLEVDQGAAQLPVLALGTPSRSLLTDDPYVEFVNVVNYFSSTVDTNHLTFCKISLTKYLHKYIKVIDSP
jgi:hypothetical protein